MYTYLTADQLVGKLVGMLYELEEHLAGDCQALVEQIQRHKRRMTRAQIRRAERALERRLEEEGRWSPEDGGLCPCGGSSCDGTCDR